MIKSQWIMKYNTKKLQNNINIKYYQITLEHEIMKIKINFPITQNQIQQIEKTGILKIGNLEINKNNDTLIFESIKTKFYLQSKGIDIIECLLWLIQDKQTENLYYTVCEITDSESESDSDNDK
jgi:hypothetical protein